MLRIFSAFTRSGGLLVFLILEAICLVLVVNYNQEQRDIYKNSKSIISDSISHGWGEITQYWNLTSVNDSLAGVIAELKAQQDEARFQNKIRRDSSNESDDDYFQQYQYIAAKVVSNTINLPNNFLVLNRGTEHGVHTRTGVFDDKGIVGIVVRSNKYYSRVMSILHRDTKISVEIKGRDAFGTLVWENSANPTIMDLKYIPNHISPSVGDTIQTNGFSTHFPRGKMVGTIEGIKEDDRGGNYHSIKVKLSNDISTTRYVYIVENLLKQEIKEMKEGVANE